MSDTKIIKISSSSNRTLYLILQSNKFICGSTVQLKSSTLYIESLDTTGFYIPRKDQKHVTRSLLNLIISDHNCKIVSVFSRPKKEILFGKSAKSKQKRIIDKFKLQKFWKSVLEPFGKVFVYSNFHENVDFPFKSLDEIVFFDDDPKFKHSKNVKDVDLKTFFETLLLRKDFIDGSLIYCEQNREKYCQIDDKNGFDCVENFKNETQIENDKFKNEKNGILENDRKILKYDKNLSDNNKKHLKMEDKENLQNFNLVEDDKNSEIDGFDCNKIEKNTNSLVYEKDKIIVSRKSIKNEVQMLRSLDFSNLKRAEKSTLSFLEKFKPEIKKFCIEKFEYAEEIEEVLPIIHLVARKK